MQFKNRLVSRCSSNPSTHQEFLFIIGLHSGHKKDEAATRMCMYIVHQGHPTAGFNAETAVLEAQPQ